MDILWRGGFWRRAQARCPVDPFVWLIAMVLECGAVREARIAYKTAA